MELIILKLDIVDLPWMFKALKKQMVHEFNNGKVIMAQISNSDYNDKKILKN